MDTDLLQSMKQSVIDGDPDAAAKLSRRAIREGLDPLLAINGGFAPGLTVVGEQFEQGEMFLPNLILAGAAMKGGYLYSRPRTPESRSCAANTRSRSPRHRKRRHSRNWQIPRRHHAYRGRIRRR